MKKTLEKTFVVLFSLVLLVSLLPTNALSNTADWSESVAVGFNGGTGTETDPYIIATAEQLSYLAQTCNEGDSYYGCFFELANDITLNSADLFSYSEDENTFSVKICETPNAWIPIGNSATACFSGTFNGCNHKIIGLYIDSESDAQGLFGYCKNSYIQNLGVTNGYVKGGRYVGGIIGYNLSDNSSTVVSNCYNNCSVNGKIDVGGLVGYNIANDSGQTIVTECYNAAVIISRTGSVGGIVGANSARNSSQMILSNCFNLASISSSSTVAGGDVGGIVGRNFSSSSSTSTVSTSYNIGAINSGYSSVGGIAGSNWSDDFASASVLNCYNTGLINGSMYDVGGIVGTNYSTNGKEAIVSNCYNMGLISGRDNLGGVAGNNTTYSGLATAKIKNCYYYDQCVKKSSSYGNPLTDTEMRIASSFSGFDFNTVWTIDGSSNYHYPELISNSHERAINVCSHARTTLTSAETATCCESGYTGDTYCNDCGEKIACGSAIPATGNHIDADGKWETDEMQHWHTCYYGTQFDVASHTGGTSTCTGKAKCSVCGVEYGEYSAHSETEIRNSKEATCCENGYTGDKYCKDCNTKISSGSVIPATGNHTDADGKWETNGTQHWYTCYYGTQFDVASHTGGTATCIEKAKCSVCGTEYGDYTEHTLTHHDPVTPDYENNGNIEYWTCDDCGKYFGDADGLNEIIADAIVIAKLVVSEYQFVDGEIIIEAPAGAIPEGALFDVQRIVPPPAEVVEKVKDQMGASSEVLAYYEIRLSDTNGELIIHLDSEITIKTKMPEQYIGSNCVRILQEDETGKLITMESWWEGEYLCYKTDWLEISINHLIDF